MEASEATVDMASVEEPKVQQVTTHAEELELPLANMTVEGPLQKGGTTTDSGVNTDADWENEVAAIFNHNSILNEQYEGLMKKQQEENEKCNKDIQGLLNKQEAAKQQHKALLQKLESVRVKLQLNNSKATIKNFLAKKEEMILEKNKENETIMRLNDELDESCRKLRELTKEQLDEKKKWRDELTELKQEMERVKKEAEEAQRLALQDEVAAVEQQRDVAMAHIQDWQREVGQYLNIVRVELPQQYDDERQQWEKKEDLVRRNQTELQSRFEEVLQQLHQGRELESLPRINVPGLPQVPMAELKFKQVMQSLAPPVFRAPPPLPPHVQNRPFPPPRHPHFYQPPFHPFHYPPQPPHFYPPTHRPPHHHPPHFPPQPSPPPAFARPPVGATPPPSVSPSPPPQLSNPAAPSTPPPRTTTAAGKQDKLDKLLERLGGRFPECTKAQLTSLLQQVKNSRGTLAGMSMEEVVVQVGLRLAKNEGSGTVAQPSQRASPAAAVEARRLCPICQKHVDPEQRHPLGCSHTIHRDCIRPWLETSKKNNTCPFCK